MEAPPLVLPRLRDGLFICGLIRGRWFRFNILDLPVKCPYCSRPLLATIYFSPEPEVTFDCSVCGKRISLHPEN